ncbi:carboxypeptidase N subunit 2-like [Anopheles coustani]|uniref:carboxypeptidase N subunit 2-like n=1 Tax=Anopheles coustani TaxID=139045 RepID=UPI002657D408|nr:carboxypeptidase N subunit 2-like [Anopheles coustani]
MHPSCWSVFLLVFAFAIGTIDAITYQCDHYEGDTYNLRYCALFGVNIVHDAEDVDFLSDYPRPYRFEFFQSNLTEIPRTLFSVFPEMQSVDLTGTGVENINKFTFENAKQLQTIYLRENKLTTLNNFIFKGCDRLLWLDLSRNQLSELKEKAFYEIPALATLDLSWNQLEKLPQDVFSTLAKLTSLDLSHNRLTGLSDSTFRSNPLITLDLNFNRLLRLGADLLSSLNSLTSLNLKGNVLKNITLPSAPKNIDLAENNLTMILLEPRPYTVVWLNLSTNALSNVANVSVLNNLRTLDLSFNSLNTLPLTTFLSLKVLNTLNLESTNLTSLEHGIFSQQTDLLWLDVSFNRLQTFDLSVLTAASKLERLHLDGNYLTALEYRWIPELFPSLTYLGLFANRWNCSYLIELIRYCRQKSISVSPLKDYGTVLHMTNVQGIYCLGSSGAQLPSARPVQHVWEKESSSSSESEEDSTETTTVSSDQLLEMIRQLNQTTLQRMLLMEGVQQAIQPMNAQPSDTSCTAMHAYSYQIFILLILSAILILNIAFLLWVQHNANARRAVDQMIVFRREHGGSIQTALNGDF